MSQVVTNQTNKFREYKSIKELGQGSFGRVDKVERGGNYFALKTFSAKNVKDERSKNIALKFFKSEIEIMKKFNHPNLVNYIDSICENDQYQILIEYCNGGSFSDYVKTLKTAGTYNEETILKIFYQILLGFEHLSQYNILHRDIKPDNTLFHNGTPKVGDFGLAKALNQSDTTTQTVVGTRITMAPEVLLGMKYSCKADIYSLGVLLYFMLQEDFPFRGKTPKEIFEAIKSQIIKYDDTKMKVSVETRNLIALMTKFQPSCRPDLSTLLLFPLFNPYALQFSNQNQQDELMTSQIGDAQQIEVIQPKSVQSNDLQQANKNINQLQQPQPQLQQQLNSQQSIPQQQQYNQQFQQQAQQNPSPQQLQQQPIIPQQQTPFPQQSSYYIVNSQQQQQQAPFPYLQPQQAPYPQQPQQQGLNFQQQQQQQQNQYALLHQQQKQQAQHLQQSQQLPTFVQNLHQQQTPYFQQQQQQVLFGQQQPQLMPQSQQIHPQPLFQQQQQQQVSYPQLQQYQVPQIQQQQLQQPNQGYNQIQPYPQQQQQQPFSSLQPIQKQNSNSLSSNTSNQFQQAPNQNPEIPLQKINSQMSQNSENQPFAKILFEQYPNLLDLDIDKQMEEFPQKDSEFEFISIEEQISKENIEIKEKFKEKLAYGAQLLKLKKQILYVFNKIGEIPSQAEHSKSTNEKKMWDKVLFFLLKEMEEQLNSLKATFNSKNDPIMNLSYEDQRKSLESYIDKLKQKMKSNLSKYQNEYVSKKKLVKELEKMIGERCMTFYRRQGRCTNNTVEQEQYLKIQLLLWNIAQFALRPEYFLKIQFTFDLMNFKISTLSEKELQKFIEISVYDFSKSI